MVSIPPPDPYPSGNAPITFVSYVIEVPAAYKDGPQQGEIIPHWWFRCSVPARWNGHVNLAGHRSKCVLFRR